MTKSRTSSEGGYTCDFRRALATRQFQENRITIASKKSLVQPRLKRKANNMASTSKRGIDNRVVIHVGLIGEDEEGKLSIVRRSKVALRVGKDFGVREVCEAAVKKHSDHD